MPEPLSEERLGEIRERLETNRYDFNAADARRCTTHSFACDCREWQHYQDLAALLAEVDRLRQLSDYTVISTWAITPRSNQ